MIMNPNANKVKITDNFISSQMFFKLNLNNMIMNPNANKVKIADKFYFIKSVNVICGIEFYIQLYICKLHPYLIFNSQIVNQSKNKLSTNIVTYFSQ